MSGGDAEEYHETKIPLPRSLQHIRTAQVIAKLFVLNPTLDSPAWADVTAEVIGKNLVVGTVTESGRKMIDSLNELKVEPGRTTKVLPATKPNNNYYVELLLPVERDSHVELLEAFLQKFPSSKFISMPGKKPWGTTRRLRLFFNTSTAPREVFTADNDTIPIREIVLKCGTAAQVLHKWQRLNQFRPPHLMHRWNPSLAPRSYANAAATAPNTSNMPTAHNNTPTSEPSTHNTPQERTNSLQNMVPADTPNTRPQNHPTDITRPTQTTDADWCSNTPFAGDDMAPLKSTTTDPRLRTSATIPHANNNTNDPMTPPPPAIHSNEQTRPANRPHRLTSNQQTRNNTNLTVHNRPANIHNDAPTTHHGTVATTTTPKLTAASADPMQWNQITRTRSRKTLAPSNLATPRSSLQRSGSRSRKTKTPPNKFAPLEFQVLPAFEDDDIQPIEVTLPSKPAKPARRKFKPTRRAITSRVTAALTNQQHVRHPAQTLQHLSPKQTQVVICSRDPELAPARDKLIQQIALLRAARTNITPHHIPLEKQADDVFLEHVQTRMSHCQDPPRFSKSSEIDIPLRAILDQDEMRVRATICFAWVDLATRAFLPHLYDMWPDPPIWQNTPLTWLPAEDEDVPCLQDESLAFLAACPALRPVWEHATSTAPMLTSSINTASTQWHIHATTITDNNASDPVQTPQE